MARSDPGARRESGAVRAERWRQPLPGPDSNPRPVPPALGLAVIPAPALRGKNRSRGPAPAEWQLPDASLALTVRAGSLRPRGSQHRLCRRPGPPHRTPHPLPGPAALGPRSPPPLPALTASSPVPALRAAAPGGDRAAGGSPPAAGSVAPVGSAAAGEGPAAPWGEARDAARRAAGASAAQGPPAAPRRWPGNGERGTEGELGRAVLEPPLAQPGPAAAEG